MKTIVSASPKDIDLLASLEIRSESYWGYDSDFMDKFKRIYLITEEFILNNPTYILKDDEIIIGFYGILLNNDEVSLEYLFIEPAYIGKGYAVDVKVVVTFPKIYLATFNCSSVSLFTGLSHTVLSIDQSLIPRDHLSGCFCFAAS